MKGAYGPNVTTIGCMTSSFDSKRSGIGSEDTLLYCKNSNTKETRK